MIRSKQKSYFYNKVIFRSKKVINENLIPIKMQNKNNEYFIQQKNSNIPIYFLNKRVCVYNGKNYHSFIISDDMLNHKFGEFVLTKKLGIQNHKEIIKNSKKKN